MAGSILRQRPLPFAAGLITGLLVLFVFNADFLMKTQEKPENWLRTRYFLYEGASDHDETPNYSGFKKDAFCQCRKLTHAKRGKIGGNLTKL